MEHGTREMLEAYGKALEDGGPLPEGVAGVLAERMESDMPVRDAVLLMAGCGKDVEWVERFLADPPAFTREIAGMLRDAFVNEPDMPRLAYADMAMGILASSAPTQVSQPLAIYAYLHWTAGDVEDARWAAEEALGRNPDNSLAALVLTALAKKLKPADLVQSRSSE